MDINRNRPISPTQIEDQYGISRTTQWRERRAGRMPPLIELSPGRKVNTEGQIADWLAERQRQAELRQRDLVDQQDQRAAGRPPKIIEAA